MKENKPNKPDPDKRFKEGFDILKEHFKSSVEMERRGEKLEVNEVVYGFQIIMRRIHRESVKNLVDLNKPFVKPISLKIYSNEGNVVEVNINSPREGLEIYLKQAQEFRSKFSEKDRVIVDGLLIPAKLYLIG